MWTTECCKTSTMLQKYNDYSDVIGIVRAQQEGHTLSKFLTGLITFRLVEGDVLWRVSEGDVNCGSIEVCIFLMFEMTTMMRPHERCILAGWMSSTALASSSYLLKAQSFRWSLCKTLISRQSEGQSRNWRHCESGKIGEGRSDKIVDFAFQMTGDGGLDRSDKNVYIVCFWNDRRCQSLNSLIRLKQNKNSSPLLRGCPYIT